MLSSVLNATYNIGFYGSNLSAISSSLMLAGGGICLAGAKRVANYYNDPSLSKIISDIGILTLHLGLGIQKSKPAMLMATMLLSSFSVKIIYGEIEPSSNELMWTIGIINLCINLGGTIYARSIIEDHLDAEGEASILLRSTRKEFNETHIPRIKVEEIEKDLIPIEAA